MDYGTKKALFRIAAVGLFALLGASPLAAGPNDITAIVGVNVIPMDINRVAKPVSHASCLYRKPVLRGVRPVGESE